MNERQKIAIIGAGISGLGAAYLLHPHHDVIIHEKAQTIGGHARTLNVKHNETEIAVDTGFIVYNEKNYPNLTRLFRKLQVATTDSTMTFGVTTKDGSLEWGAENLNALFAQRRNLFRPDFYRFLADILRFNRRAKRVCNKNSGLNLGQLIDKLVLGKWFQNYYLLPMGGAIWSCPLKTMLGFPAKFFVDFFEAHGLLTVTQQPQWRTVIGGSRAYIDKLTADFKDKIRTNCSINSIKRQDGKIHITANGQTDIYDQVVFACHASEALQLMVDSTDGEKKILGAFRQQKNIAFLHKDTSLMPRRKAAWSSWVYHSGGDNAGPISVTYWMNKLQHIDVKHPLFVTLNPRQTIDQANIFDMHVFYHPIYDPDAVAAQEKLSAMQGLNDTWFCGAYTRYGFHEDGLASAVDVCRRMGITAPW